MRSTWYIFVFLTAMSDRECESLMRPCNTDVFGALAGCDDNHLDKDVPMPRRLWLCH